MTYTSRHIYAAAVLLTLTLTGCSASAGSTNVLAPAALSATAVPAPTPSAIPGDKNGDGKLSEFEKQIVAKNAVRPYTLPDGSTVDVDPNQPLPEAVDTAVQAHAAPILEAYRFAEGADVSPAFFAIRAEVDAQAASVGKGIIFVFPGISDDGSGPISVWLMMASTVDISPVGANPSFDELLAETQSWAAARGYEVLVFQ